MNPPSHNDLGRSRFVEFIAREAESLRQQQLASPQKAMPHSTRTNRATPGRLPVGRRLIHYDAEASECGVAVLADGEITEAGSAEIGGQRAELGAVQDGQGCRAAIDEQ